MAETYPKRVSRSSFLLLLLYHASSVAAQTPDPSEKRTREEIVRELRAREWEAWAAPVEGQLTIDGRLDEPAWQSAQPITEFYQRDREDGTPESERTEVRILYDDDNLYLGFICFDREMDKVISRAIFRDESGAYDDQLVILIDPYNDHRGAYVFSTNANGFKIDGLQTGEAINTLDANWDAVWDAGGSRDADRWQAELAIPFKSLRYKAPAEGEEIVFGIGFKRNLRRRNEEDIWPFVSKDSSWYRPASLGHLRGISKANPGRNLEFRPYALGETAQDFDRDLEDRRGELGLDAKWGITPALTADFSVNTDFAQEEVDLQQINFTRFSLFFPEKRQFFLEGERMFQFGLRQEAELVFTRRIGLSPVGEVVPILAGARLSGREGRYTLGAMNIQTQESGALPSENFTVLRLRRDVFNRSTVGALFTNRQGGGRFNRVYGADVNLLLRDAWTFEGFFARTDEDTEHGDAGAAYLRAAFDKDLWGTGYRFLDIEESFAPGVGFVRRPNSEEHFGEVRFSPRPGVDWIRQFHLTGSVSYIRNQQKTLETRNRAVRFVTGFESGDSLTFNYTNRLEAITEPFDLRSEISIAPGTYRFDVFDAEFSSFRGRPTQFSALFSHGGFWDGNRTIAGFKGRYRPSKHFELSGSWETNWLDFPQGNFLTHLVSTRILIAFRPDLMLLPLLQYNHDTGLFSANVRFNWIPKPGTDFFIVYNELNEWNEGLGPKNRSLVIKLVYLFSL